MDSLTTHHVARELDARWRGRRIAGVSFSAGQRAIECAVDGAPAVVFDLSAPDVEIREVDDSTPGSLLCGWRVLSVTAPLDERIISIECEKVGRFRGSRIRRAQLVVSVVPAARGAVLEDSSGHRLAVMGKRLPATAGPRPELDAETVTGAAAERNAERLLRGRWMSLPLALWLADTPERAAQRYAAICELARPMTDRCREGLLPPWLCEPASLVRPKREQSDHVPRPGDRDTWRERALQRMREELERAGAAPRLRAVADALAAHGDAAAPADVLLPSGERAPVAARQGETAIAVAERLYREVRSMERALATLPRRIEELAHAPASDGAVRGGSVSRARREGATRGGASRPYRLYRSSGGLEIWVGRGAASNDIITFRESSAADVWLHARAAAGAHVILRWQQEGAPPARDLEEAAMLAAWHSKARSSTVVPVDWTRRRHVRRARGAGPGKVLVTQAQTLFVRPTHQLERRLRDTGAA